MIYVEKYLKKVVFYKNTSVYIKMISLINVIYALTKIILVVIYKGIKLGILNSLLKRNNSKNENNTTSES